MAVRKLGNRSREGRESMVSHPSGKPDSDVGNGTWRSWILRPDWADRETVAARREALRGVLIRVMDMLYWASSLVMSIMGIRWPWVRWGRRRKWRGVCEAIFLQDWEE